MDISADMACRRALVANRSKTKRKRLVDRMLKHMIPYSKLYLMDLLILHGCLACMLGNTYDSMCCVMLYVCVHGVGVAVCGASLCSAVHCGQYSAVDCSGVSAAVKTRKAHNVRGSRLCD